MAFFLNLLMSKLKLAALSTILIITAIIYIQIDLISYGFSQLKGQINVIWNSRPIEDVLGDPHINDTIKQKLILIQEIKAFAVDSLGIKPSENYSSFFDQKNKPLLFVLTGAEPFSMKDYKWSFPFLGLVSYKGFFDKESGKKEEIKLQNLGYDTDLGVVGAWSTLGWFKDPVLSAMLKKNEGDLANLIIHELTHGTLYIKDNVEFNENLASFIGEKGAVDFLTHKYGRNSKELKVYLENKADDETFSKYILNEAQALDSLYKSFNNSYSTQDKTKHKMQLINTIVGGVNNLTLFHKEKYLFISSFAKKEKNAFFMSYMRYRSTQGDFEQEFKKYSGLKAYLDFLKKTYSSL